ncbi:MULTISPECIES: response regulator [unclassified Paenibacillus]|uniref:response regulator transcription factor n=1 Tax=unclassified Paenibacillus TaxID=185978 RepID=UPI000897B4C7|nr:MULTISPECIES: response regulator [unclassified Paenibacillus]OMC71999.1 DNA-binding response regulator [Paenibacillus sp. FSL H7-0326]SDX32916.1 two-component system, response regulator YesN [Paenibacillus sp. PDC88]
MNKPYQVLIADDEPIIREGISDSVDWASLGMEVIGLAEDGAEALELVLERGADLVLVDMNMPIMNGISFIQALREQKQECRCIIITGYDEFSYAQQAIRLGVEEYILKPVETDELMRVLQRIKASLDEEQLEKEKQASAREHLHKRREVLREQLGQEWVQGRLNEEELRMQLSLLSLPADSPASCLVIRWPEASMPNTILKEGDRQLYLYAVKNIVEELIGTSEALVFRNGSDLIVGISWSRFTPELLMKIEEAAKENLGVTIHTASEDVGVEMELLQAYNLCKECIYQEASLSPLVRRARQYLQEHYHNHALTLELVASELGVSPVYLSRMLKKELGESFIALLTGIRIHKAIQLLNSSSLTMHEIADHIGYESQHYFSTAFKKVMGISPNKYRKGEAFV